VVEEGAKKAFEDLRPITTEDIISAIRENPPRLNETAIEEHKKRIGFL